MAIINEGDKGEISQLLEKMNEEVRLVVFSKENCVLCSETLEICQELSDLGKKLSVEHYVIGENPDKAEKYSVDKTPAIVLDGMDRKGIRFFGVPAGFEFTSLIEDILDLSMGSSNLSQVTKESLGSLERDVHLEVFVTPTCPFCPRMVRLAHMFAVVSPRIIADAVQSAEFPDLAMKYRVMGVPSVVINGVKSFDGAQAESFLLKRIMET